MKDGAKGFSKEYWDINYHRPEEMDGIGNVKDHVGYIKHLFDLEFIDISSIVDLGFGLGHLFEGLLKTFVPYRALGIEPSDYAFNEVMDRSIAPVDSMKLTLKKIDILSWCRNEKYNKRFDLGVCTSVFQYLSDEELEECIPVIGQRVKYLYLSVPTNLELDRQIEELEFKDEYAIRRTRNKYQKYLKKHFTFISARMLESKEFFTEESTSFTDLLFRF